MDEENDDDIRPLYERFKEVIYNCESTAEFDEIDLVSIYDYAGDMRDYYIQFEVLLLAARRFPHNQELGSRKGFFVRDILDNPLEASRIAGLHTGESFAWTMLALATDSAGISAADLERRIDKALDRADMLEDEDIIRLIDLVQDNKLFDWISRRRQAISKKCEYPDTLLREMAEMYYEAGMIDQTIALYEEATRLQPFHAPFWLRLSEMQEMNQELDAARTSIEYALAINPTNDAYFLQDTRLRYYDSKITPDDEKRMASIIAADDSNSVNAVRVLFSWYNTTQQYGEMMQHGQAMLETSTRTEVATELLDQMFNVPNIGVILKALDAFDNKGITIDLQGLKETVSECFRRDLFHATAALCLHYDILFNDPTLWAAFTESLYRVEKYDHIIELFKSGDTVLKPNKFLAGDTTMSVPLLTVAFSMLQRKKYDDFDTLVSTLHSTCKTEEFPAAAAMEFTGFISAIDYMAKHYRDPDFRLDDVVPFFLPHH